MAITTKHYKVRDSQGSKIIELILRYFDNLLGCVGCFGVYSGAFNYLIMYSTLDIRIISYAMSGAMVSLILNSLIKK